MPAKVYTIALETNKQTKPSRAPTRGESPCVGAWVVPPGHGHSSPNNPLRHDQTGISRQARRVNTSHVLLVMLAAGAASSSGPLVQLTLTHGVRSPRRRRSDIPSDSERSNCFLASIYWSLQLNTLSYDPLYCSFISSLISTRSKRPSRKQKERRQTLTQTGYLIPNSPS